MKKTTIGTALILLSLFMLLGFFNADLKGGIVIKIASLIITFVLPLTGGSYLIYSHYQDKQKLQVNKNNLRLKTMAAEILKLADKKGGKLTVVEVMSDFALDKEQAKELLDSLAVEGLADVELTESGVIVYSFYDISRLNEKQAAKGVLDV